MKARPWVEAGTFNEAWSAVEGEGEFHLVVGGVIVRAGAAFHHGHLAALLLVIDSYVPLWGHQAPRGGEYGGAPG